MHVQICTSLPLWIDSSLFISLLHSFLFPFYILFIERTTYQNSIIIPIKLRITKQQTSTFFLQFIINGSEGGGVKNLGVHVVIKCFDTVSVIISPKS